MRLYEDGIRSVEHSAVVLPQLPAGQEERQSESREDDHDRREDQCQQQSNQVRLVNPRKSVSVRVFVPVHLATFLLARLDVAHSLDAMPVWVLTCVGAWSEVDAALIYAVTAEAWTPTTNCSTG